MKDVLMLDKMYELNMNITELSMYVAGKKGLERANNIELPALIKRRMKADFLRILKAKEFSQMINRFEKIYDWSLQKQFITDETTQIKYTKTMIQ